MTTGGNKRDWTRRRVLAASGAALGAAALGRASRATGPAPEQNDSTYGPFKMGLQSYSLRGYTHDGRADTVKALAATRELGVRYWEAFPAHVPLDADAQQTAERKRQLAAAGVTLLGYGVVHLGKDQAANRRIFDFARTMGITYLSASPDPDSFDGLDKLVEEYGVAVGIHNHGPGDRYARIATIEQAIKDHHPRIGCCVDTGHFLRSREDPVHAVEAFGKRVYGVHLKDVKDGKTFTLLGKGDLRTVELLKVLIRNRYEHCLALEYEENPENPLDDIKACLAEVRKAITEATQS